MRQTPATGRFRLRSTHSSAAVFTLAAITLSACANQAPKVIENRFKSASTGTTLSSKIGLTVTTASVPESGSSVKITELSNRGQAALIEATKGAPPIALKARSSTAGNDLVTINTIKRRFVVAVRPNEFLSPGDRVDAVTVTLQVNDQGPDAPKGWRISNWSKASNGQVVIDVGKLTDVAESKATASTGLLIGKPLVDTSVGVESSRTITREAEIKDTTDFNASLSPSGVARLDETAGWRVNLARNLSIDATVQAAKDHLIPISIVKFSKLASKNPKTEKVELSEAGAVTVNEITRFVHIQAEKPICGMATLNYRIRHIKNASARGTFTESDDEVEFQSGKSAIRFLLAPAPYVPTYLLKSSGEIVSYERLSKISVMEFGSLAEATAFRNWFVAKGPRNGRLANATVGISDGLKIEPMSDAKRAAILVSAANPVRVANALKATADGCATTTTKR